ncbi:MAG: hypothetical protein AB7N76_22180 [Planctomycetota bacterium]
MSEAQHGPERKEGRLSETPGDRDSGAGSPEAASAAPAEALRGEAGWLDPRSLRVAGLRGALVTSPPLSKGPALRLAAGAALLTSVGGALLAVSYAMVDHVERRWWPPS